MIKIAIIGNSSSGKSSLALKLVQTFNLAHLDLDLIAWEAQKTPIRRSLSSSLQEIMTFINKNENWVIEGCYGDLIREILPYTNLLIFLNIGVETCLENAKKRSWEKHKYDTPEAQEANLSMLESWIKGYFLRNDEFSFSWHQQLFESFTGQKIEYKTNWNEDIIKLINL
ncbi:shikimate kinase [Geminocystis sp. GBBB08]|uniref:shikimate kinase n=1 Tax=Geminocystis sp. GBBB08 TaxID=2604140 RepID=UPI0027E245AC|nr:shikimate kinase [Geminocystis sp. GBBB08]MBL1209284.1 shikimate kinase [Geminocystis sp. GBBB08]